MRLLLDANLSPGGIAAPLRTAGHDVLALAEDPTLEGLDDPAVLELAASENRVLITRNSWDFAPLAREWAEAQRPHAGMILIWTLDHSQFRKIVEGIERCIDQIVRSVAGGIPSTLELAGSRHICRRRRRAATCAKPH